MNTDVHISEVLKRINLAKEQADALHLVFIDRRGKIGWVSTTPCTNEGWTAGDIEELEVQAGTPYFEVCTVGYGEVMSNGDIIQTEDNDALQAALDFAVSERIRFYREREEVFGPSAWPSPR